MSEELSKQNHVDPQDPQKENSPIVENPPSGGATIMQAVTCMWNGVAYSPGGKVCSYNKEYKCGGDGTWWLVGDC